jgi:hypothetical protein
MLKEAALENSADVSRLLLSQVGADSSTKESSLLDCLAFPDVLPGSIANKILNQQLAALGPLSELLAKEHSAFEVTSKSDVLLPTAFSTVLAPSVQSAPLPSVPRIHIAGRWRFSRHQKTDEVPVLFCSSCATSPSSASPPQSGATTART